VSDTGSPEPLVKYVLSDGISQAFLPFRFVDVTVITDHDLFWNVDQANHFGPRSGSLNTILEVDYPRTIHTMFALNWLTGFRGEDFYSACRHS
jgi:hypothetical protein